jgi:DNA repair protein RadC
MPHHGENPVDRVSAGGPAAASIIDLLAVAFTRNPEDAKSGEDVAREILRKYERAQGLNEASVSDLMELTGLDRFESIQRLALMELGRRASITRRGDVKEISLPDQVFERLKHLQNERKEHFVVVTLDAKCHILRTVTVHVGTVNMSVVGAREIFREAVRDGACSIIVAHNHPSGDPTPSPEDIDVTKRLVEAGKLMDIPVLDHVIIGYENHFSFSRKGMI